MADKSDVFIRLSPGRGKTRAMIEILRREYNRQKKVCNTLIFAPLSVCPGWKVEFSKYSKIPEDQILILNQSGKKRVQLFTRMIQKYGAGIVVTNYESVQMKEFYEAIYNWKPDVIILDESHKVRESTGVRAKKIYALGDRARRRFCLTGTIAPNSLLDVYGQYRFFNKKIFGDNFWKFKQLYFYDRNAGMPAHVHFPDWQPLPEAAKNIALVLASTGIDVMPGEDIKLPDLIEIKVPVELSSSQLKAYKEMETEFITEFKGSISTAEFAMTKTLRMRQILTGYVPDNKDKAQCSWFDDSPRLQAYKDLLDSLKGQKIIVWSEFIASYGKLYDIAIALGFKCAFMTGLQSAKEKQQAVEGFQTGDIDILICHPASASEGLNLQCSKYSIYYAKGYSNVFFEQSKHRNHRAGSKDTVCHYHLVATNTLDEVISNALINKRRVGETLLQWVQGYS